MSDMKKSLKIVGKVVLVGVGLITVVNEATASGEHAYKTTEQVKFRLDNRSGKNTYCKHIKNGIRKKKIYGKVDFNGNFKPCKLSKNEKNRAIHYF